MNIAYLSNSTIPSRRANSVHVMKMCQAFSDLGHTVTLFAKQGHKILSIDVYSHYGVRPNFKIEFCYHPPSRLGKFAYAFNVVRALKWQEGDNILYGRDAYSLYAARCVGAPLIFESHHPPPGFLRKHVERRLCQLSSFFRLVVISEALRRKYLEMWPWLAKSSVLVAHDGADTLDQVKTENRPFRPDKKNGRLQVGYVGHLYPGKGMEIISRIAPECPHMDFHIVGGDDQDIHYWKDRNRSGNLHFHGYVPNHRVSDFLSVFDVVLAPYQQQVMIRGSLDIGRYMSPLKLFEYMAHGKAIVASDLPVIREIVDDGVNGILVPPNQPEAWIGAVERLRGDPELIMKLGERAEQKLRWQFTWKERARSVIAGIEGKAE